MSLVSKLRAALAIPAVAAGDVKFLSPYDDVNHLWPIVAPDWFPDRATLTRAQAMQIPAVSRARRVICNSIARLPLRAYRGDALVTPQPLWLDRTDGPVSPYHRMLYTVDDLFFYGLSCWAVERNTDGSVRAADRIPFDRWHIDHDAGEVVYHADDGSEYVTDPRDVIVIPGNDEGLLTASAPALRHARDLLTAAAKASETPSAYIELHQTNAAPITETQVNDMVTKWKEARRTNGGVAFTSNGVEVREHGSFDAHLLVDGRNAAALDIARAAGVPGSILDANNGSSLTYETGEQKARDLLDYGLTAYMAPISARLGLDDVVPAGVRVAFDLEELLGPGTSAGTPDDGGASKRPAPTPVAGGRPLTPPATGTTNGATR